MSSAILIACLPWAIVLIVAVLVARLLVYSSGATLKLSRLKQLNRCEGGAVESLAFVLTLPFFILIILLIVQAMHIMIANINVHYAAYATARAASVWIPANAGSSVEAANRIGVVQRFPDIQQPHTGLPIGPDPNSEDSYEFDHEAEIFHEGEVTRWRITDTEGWKFPKIKEAAVLALMPLGPSRTLGYELDSQQYEMAYAYSNLFKGLDGNAAFQSNVERRLYNKLAYNFANTDIDITYWHRNRIELFRDYHRGTGYAYDENEMGWQDPITVKVSYRVPLLPGPIRLFAKQTQAETTGDGIVSLTDESGQVYIWSIGATATMGNEGERSVMSYWQREFQ